jgi:hypothetical protein
MNVDLPPSSAFAADPAVARPRSMRDPLTLTLPVQDGQVRDSRELMSGSISMDAASSPGDGCLGTAIAAADDRALTITF